MVHSKPRRLSWILVISALAVLGSVVAIGKADAAPRAATVFERAADIGSSATVGVYYDESQFIKYYGTGVIISADGYVLTSTTVVPPGSSDNIEIYFSDHTIRPARLVETVEKVEAALLKVEGKDLPHLPLAKEIPDLGERTYTLANARHMMRSSAQASFSAGRVTGIYEVGSDPGLSSYEGLAIETDAAINPGQDGGPLMNARGQLAGIVSLSFSDARWLGVAVPIGRICESVEAIKNGTVQTSSNAPLNPPSSDEKTGRAFARTARKLSASLVRLHVKREYGPEKMPRYFWPRFLAQHREKWDNADTEKRRRMVGAFTRAEKVLGANQQLRRPDDPATGVMVSPDGYILTSEFNVATDTAYIHKEHGLQDVAFDWDLGKLLANPQQYRQEKNPVVDIRAVLSDGRSFAAEVVARHTPLSIALLKVDGNDLPHINLSEQGARPELGRNAAALGVMNAKQPFTVNIGIISAAKRRRDRFFQFGGMLNFANSGGPVVDSDGNLLGIATDPLRPGPVMGAVLPWQQIVRRWYVAPNSGISFAARTDWIQKDLARLKKGKSVRRIRGAFIGIGMDPRKALSEGAFVGRVVGGSPAEAAGLQRGDQILAVDDRKIGSWKELTDAVQQYEVGDRVILKVRRLKDAYRKELEGEEADGDDEDAEEAEAPPDEESDASPYKILEVPLTLGERQ